MMGFLFGAGRDLGEHGVGVGKKVSRTLILITIITILIYPDDSFNYVDYRLLLRNVRNVR